MKYSATATVGCGRVGWFFFFGHKMSDILELTTKISRHEESAFDTFYAAYYPRLYQYLLVIASGREDLVHDVLQETMLRVVKYCKPVAEETVFWAWLTRLARTAWIDYQRRHGRRTSVEWDDSMSPVNAEAATHEKLLTVLEEVVNAIPPGDRQIVEECYLKQQPQAIVASQNHLTLKALESRLNRIRKKLKRLLLERLKYD